MHICEFCFQCVSRLNGSVIQIYRHLPNIFCFTWCCFAIVLLPTAFCNFAQKCYMVELFSDQVPVLCIDLSCVGKCCVQYLIFSDQKLQLLDISMHVTIYNRYSGTSINFLQEYVSITFLYL